MIPSKLFFGTLCLSFPLLFSGCTEQNLNVSKSVDVPTHKAISGQRDQILEREPSLLVGLHPYLGRKTKGLQLAQELRLKSAGGPLILKDESGLVHKSREITIAWRDVPLPTPKTFGRQVVGPFASFESAQRLALRLRNEGFSALIAHPDNWEVWVPLGRSLPQGIDFLRWHQAITSEVQPVLKGVSGEILLTGPVKIEAGDGLQLKDGVFWGPFWLKADAYGSWTLVEQVPLERYLLGVVPYEIGSSAPSAALAAQAVLARTWALANKHRFAIDGYHLCSDTQCQVYKDPSKASPRVKDAIAKTAGKYLRWQNKPIHAVYHATNGGVMASASEAWSMAPVPYLRAELDGSNQWLDRFVLPLDQSSALRSLLRQSDGAYGNKHPRFRWTRIFQAEDLRKRLDPFLDANVLPSRVKVLERGTSGRVLSLEIFSEENQLRKVLELDGIRRILRELPSTLFVVNELRKGVWQFSGGGFGHGVGLSQSGAIDLARKGWKASQILKHYYPGTTYGTLQHLPKAP